MRLPKANFLPLVIALQLLAPALACEPPVKTDNGTFPRFHLGPDVVPDQATVAFSMNHFSLLVNDLTASLYFYTRILGLRVIHQIEVTDWFGIVYLGYSHGGRNGTGWQPSTELYRERSNTEGLVELMYRKNRPERREGSSEGRGTLSHIGLTVPDVPAAQKRMEENNVTIIRRAGELPDTIPEPLARSFGLLNLTKEENDVILRAIPRYLMVTDPDGNIIEVQPQN